MEKTRVSRTDGKSRLFIKAALCFILIFGLGMAMAQNLMATDYTQVMSFGSYGSDDGQFNTVIAIAVDSYGNIFIADAGNNRIQKFSSSGAYLGKFGTYGTGNGQFDSPSGIAFDSYGNVFVTDSNNNRIQKFSSSGTYLGKFGTYGTGNGQFNYPFGLAIDSSDNIYVTDNTRVQKLNSSGTYLSSYSSILKPSGVAVDNMGWIYVADFVYNNVKVFGSSGTLLYTIGTTGYGNGQFNSPKGVATDSSGNFLYVADTDNNRIQILSYNGTYIGQFSSGLYEPWGVALDSSGNVYVADSMNSKIKKFSSSAVSTYTISGYVYDSSYNYLSGVTMTTSSGDYTTTDYSGYYSLTVSSGWSGTVTPSKSGYTFSPGNTSYSYVYSNQSSPYYIGTPTVTTYTISGYVYDASTYAYLSDVTMTTSSGSTTTTDSSGNYSFTVSSGWSGTITPSKSGCTFTPSSKSYSSVSYSYSYEAYSASCSGGTSFVTRTLPTTYTPGVKLTVALTATPPSGTTNYTVKDTPPAGWEVDPNTISSGGIFDTTAKNVRFIVMNGNSGTFTYDVTPPASETGDKTFSGTANINGTTNSVIGGQANISKGLSNHPADNNPADLQLTDSETNAYIHAWLVGATWTTGPNPIPASYAVRAGGLWLGGTDGRYKTDSTAGNAPYCWVNTTGTRSERDGTSSTAVRQMSSPYTAGKPMTVSIIVTFGTKNANPSYSLTDQVPSGWTASNFKSNGISDSTAQFVNGKVQFFFYDKLSRTVSYDVTPPAGESGTKTFSGTADFFNEAIPITGVSFISDTGGTGSNTPGDLNGSGGEPNLADAILGLQVLAGLNPPNVKVGADVNGDQKIGLPEVIYILQKVAGLRPSGT